MGCDPVTQEQITSYSFTAPAGYAVQDIRVPLGSYSNTYHVTFTQIDNSEITTTMRIESGSGLLGSLFVDEATVSFSGGTTSVDSYPKLAIFSLMPTYRYFYLQSNTTGTKTYYLACINSNRITLQTDWRFDLDTSEDAYYELSSKPSLNPIVEFSVVGTTSDYISGHYTYGTISNLASSEINPGIGYDNGPLGIYQRLINAIQLVVDGIKALLDLIGGGLSFIYGGGLFILSAKVFLVIVAAYEAIVLVLSVDDVTEWHVAIKRWIRYQKALWHFFWDVFKFMKDIIKWW